MTANRSLDEFAAGSSDEPAEPDEPEATADSAVADAPSSPEPAGEERDEAVESVESTYQWTPGGGPCAVCGASAEERWRQGAGLVCPDCKEW